MATECNGKPFEFHSLGQRNVWADSVTSDGGGLLLQWMLFADRTRTVFSRSYQIWLYFSSMGGRGFNRAISALTHHFVVLPLLLCGRRGWERRA